MSWHSLLICLLFFFLPTELLKAQPYSKLEKKLVRSIYKDSDIHVDKVPNLLIIYAFESENGQINLDLHPQDSLVLNPDKPVSIGDISQFWTAQQIMNLVQKGRFSLTDDINLFLPQGYQNPTPTSIESLLTHYSGLPKIPNNFGQYEIDPVSPYRFYTDTALLQFFQSYSLTAVKNYKYSTVNYALLQLLLAQNGIQFSKETKTTNQGHRNGHPITPISYYQFACAKGLQMSPNELFSLIQDQKETTQSYPIFPTSIQKKTFSSYGFHVIKRYGHEIAILKSATNGFSIMAAFDRNQNRTLLIVSDAQDHSGNLFRATSWFFR